MHSAKCRASTPMMRMVFCPARKFTPLAFEINAGRSLVDFVTFWDEDLLVTSTFTPFTCITQSFGHNTLFFAFASSSLINTEYARSCAVLLFSRKNCSWIGVSSKFTTLRLFAFVNTNFVGFATTPFGRVGLKLVGETNAKYGSEFNARSNVSCILFSALDNFDAAGDNEDGACC